jgi:disulfide bond formation protein DsbB
MVIPTLIGGLLGLMMCARNRIVAGLLLLAMLTRTIFLGYHYAPESRYIVEAYPAMIAACGVTCAALWNHFNQRFRRDRASPERAS